MILISGVHCTMVDENEDKPGPMVRQVDFRFGLVVEQGLMAQIIQLQDPIVLKGIETIS